MTIDLVRISDLQAQKLIAIDEGQFADVKSVEITPASLTKTISAFANADGGDLYIGIAEVGRSRSRSWAGFGSQENANGHLQIFEQLFPLGTDFQYEFLRCDAQPGLVLHVQVNKTHSILPASNNLPYVRREAQNFPGGQQEVFAPP